MKSFVSLVTLVILGLVVSGCTKESPTGPATENQASARTFVLKSVTDSRLPAPMLEAEGASNEEMNFIKAMVGRQPGLGGDPFQSDASTEWNMLTTDLGIKAKLPPPKLSRAYALVQAAIYDALLAAHETRRHDLVDNAVAAGAASNVLMYLFPKDSLQIMSRIPGQLRVAHGLAYGRVLRSWRLGRRVGELAVEHGKNDGSGAAFTGTMPTGDGIWTGTNPVLPMCGTWQTWITTSGSEFQSEPPYAYGSHEDSVEMAQVYEASLHRTDAQIAIVHKWADLPPPTIWNTYLNTRVANDHLTIMQSARAHAYLNVAMYDAFVSCWNTKYIYWTARPFQRIPGLVTVITTPNFPAYTSGHSTISGAAAVVMGELFPAEKVFFSAEAQEAALSRLYGGIHFQHDNDQGLVVGTAIGEKTVSVMQTDGSTPLLSM